MRFASHFQPGRERRGREGAGGPGPERSLFGRDASRNVMPGREKRAILWPKGIRLGGRPLVRRGVFASGRRPETNSGIIGHRLTENCMRTKTLSDYPLLIGEVLRRSEMKRLRRERWKTLLRSVYVSGDKGVLRWSVQPARATLRRFTTFAGSSDR
jgi:hypothetical protein